MRKFTKNMCLFQQLYSDENGYIVRCNECGCYQVMFSNVMLSMKGDEFEIFLRQVAVRKKINNALGPLLKTILLPTPCPGVHMVLSLREFDQLDRMLELAETEIKALALLDLFYS